MQSVCAYIFGLKRETGFQGLGEVVKQTKLSNEEEKPSLVTHIYTHTYTSTSRAAFQASILA